MRAAHLLKVINGIYLDVIGFEKADNVALLSFFLGIISLLTNAYYAVSDVKKVIRQDAEEKPFSYVGAPPPHTHTLAPGCMVRHDVTSLVLEKHEGT